uniref:Urotensin-related peptide 1 n=1 Tax=Oncorhynchus kisutch TaxID=8019 RepID=A0A8C7I438_ONCKI
AIVIMLSLALFYILAVICSARRTHALPLYPDTSLEPQEGMGTWNKAGEERRNLESRHQGLDMNVLISHNSLPYVNQKAQLVLFSTASHPCNMISSILNCVYVLNFPSGAKDSVQQDKFVNMVDDLKAVVLKLAAADKLRSQGFLRSEQNLPKTNKRACFWKYCVTN